MVNKIENSFIETHEEPIEIEMKNNQLRAENACIKMLRQEGADIFLDYLSDQSKSMSVLYRTQIS